MVMTDYFRKGASVLAQLSARWLNEVGARVTYIIGCDFLSVIIPQTVTANTPIKIGIDRAALAGTLEQMGFASPSQAIGTISEAKGNLKTDTETDDDFDGDEWTWYAGGDNGLRLDCYTKIEKEDGWHYFGRCRLTISKDGLITKVMKIPGRREIEA